MAIIKLIKQKNVCHIGILFKKKCYAENISKMEIINILTELTE